MRICSLTTKNQLWQKADFSLTTKNLLKFFGKYLCGGRFQRRSRFRSFENKKTPDSGWWCEKIERIQGTELF